MKNDLFLMAGAVITVLGLVMFRASSVQAGVFWTAVGLAIFFYARRKRRA